MVHPTPNRLIRHRHSAFRQQIFDVAQAEGEPEVEPYCLVNDLGRETIPAVADFHHPLGYSATGRTASPTRRDNALAVLRATRSNGNGAPVVVITARDAIDDRIAGLDTGADDYIVKP